MKDSEHSPGYDITKEPYKGPSIASAAAGEGFIAHMTVGIGGMLAGALIGYFAPNKIGKMEQAFSEFHTKGVESSNWLIKIPAWSARLLQKGSESLTHVFTKNNMLQSRLGLKNEQLQAIIFSSGVLGSIGYFVFPWLLGPRGARKGIEGRRQFEDAKSEIVKLREANNHLREKLAGTQTELEDAKTSSAAKKGLLNVAHDEPPSIKEDAEPVPGAVASTLARKQENWVDTVASQKAAAPEASLT